MSHFRVLMLGNFYRNTRAVEFVSSEKVTTHNYVQIWSVIFWAVFLKVDKGNTCFEFGHGSYNRFEKLRLGDKCRLRVRLALYETISTCRQQYMGGSIILVQCLVRMDSITIDCIMKNIKISFREMFNIMQYALMHQTQVHLPIPFMN